jgi:segregation and condensation protein B
VSEHDDQGQVVEGEGVSTVSTGSTTDGEGSTTEGEGSTTGAPEGTETTETLEVPVAALRPALEAVLMVADQPLDHVTLASAVGYPPEQVREALTGLAEEYAEQGRGFDLRNVASGWRFYTREEYAAVVERFVLDGQQARLTQAALETLAVVAYKQPVSRARVSAVRGVNVDGVMRTLVARGLVEEAGQDSETTATLYRTTSYFLERIGVQSLEDLPELAPYLPEMGDLDDMGDLESQTA